MMASSSLVRSCARAISGIALLLRSPSPQALGQIKLAIAVLVTIFSLAGHVVSSEQGTTNAAASLSPLRPLIALESRSASVIRSRKPLSAMSITNSLSQTEILNISDPVSVRNGLTGYIDGMCGFGARLHRDYVGSGSVVSVSFLWDGSPKVTRFSFHGTNYTAARTWHAEMLNALSEKVGAENVRVEVQPGGAANRSQPGRSRTNQPSAPAGAVR